MAYDQSIYYATVDSPGGPMYVPVQEPGVGNDHVYRDEDGNATPAGQIGQLIAYAILLAAFVYYRFFL